MPTGVDKQPIIKQHFDAIEDQIVVDAIARRLGRFKNKEGVAYQPDTFTANDSHSILSTITEVCAEVYEPGIDHEEVWQRAQSYCVGEVFNAHGRLLVDYKRSDPDSPEVIKWRKRRFDHAYAALAMYALERHTDTEYDPSYTQHIDELLTNSTGDLPDVIESIQKITSTRGVAVLGEDPSDILLVDRAIEHRKDELEEENYNRLLTMTETKLPEIKSQEKLLKKLEKCDYAMMRMRLADNVLSREHYDNYLAAVANTTDDGGWRNAAFLGALPQSYLRQAYEEKGVGAETIDNLIQKYAKSMREFGVVHHRFLATLHRYFPGGIAGEVARSNPHMQSLAEKVGGFRALMLDALPSPAYTEGEGRREEIRDHNDMTRSLMLSACQEAFPDVAFAARYHADLLRSVEPRYFSNDDHVSLRYSKVHDALSRLMNTSEVFGSETLQNLHESFDLAAIDAISHNDISVMLGLQRGDKAMIKFLQTRDVSLVVFDAYGDHNGGSINTVKQLESPGRILVPWRRASDLYRTLALLKSHDVKFCRLIVSAHGNAGVVLLNKDLERTYLISEPLPPEMSFTEPAVKNLYINQSAIGRIARDYMRKPEYAEGYGMPTQKTVIYTSCFGDVGIPGAIDSVAEATAREIGRIQSKKLGINYKGETVARYPGIIDTQVMGTENLNVTYEVDDKPGLAIYGPARDEVYDERRATLYPPNMQLLTPSQRTFISQRGRTVTRTDIVREPFNYRIFA